MGKELAPAFLWHSGDFAVVVVVVWTRPSPPQKRRQDFFCFCILHFLTDGQEMCGGLENDSAESRGSCNLW